MDEKRKLQVLPAQADVRSLKAVRKLQVVDFPAVVEYDCYGNSVYKHEKAVI
ncbi:MAG: hypothetical protein ACYSUX_10185 [Planctomycetota bacterium]|jgi:tartrate dehydratase beta subunit/fumarate hydratase class I family protein